MRRRWEWSEVGVIFGLSPFAWQVARWNDGGFRVFKVGPVVVGVRGPRRKLLVFEQTADGLGAYLDRYNEARVECRCGWRGPQKDLLAVPGADYLCPKCGSPFAAMGWRDGTRRADYGTIKENEEPHGA